MNTDLHALPSFDDAMPLGLGDEEFIRDLHDVLEKHSNLNRFGLCLLHDHFAVAADEILLESNDHTARTLNLEVVKRADLPTGKFTSWRIGGPNAQALEALTACAMDKCKIEALTACAMDKCKIEALTACAMDKCKIEALTACAMDKCKIEALTACAMDKCKIEALTACAMDKCKIEALTACAMDKCKIEA
jgi:hypothetical protein